MAPSKRTSSLRTASGRGSWATHRSPSAARLSTSAHEAHVDVIAMVGEVSDDPFLVARTTWVLKVDTELGPSGTPAAGFLVERALQLVVDVDRLGVPSTEPLAQEDPLVTHVE